MLFIWVEEKPYKFIFCEILKALQADMEALIPEKFPGPILTKTII